MILSVTNMKTGVSKNININIRKATQCVVQLRTACASVLAADCRLQAGSCAAAAGQRSPLEPGSEV